MQRLSSRPRRAVQSFLLALPLLLTSAPLLQAGEIPPSLRPIVMHARHREIAAIELAGTRFDALTPFSSRPYLAWPAAPDARAPFEQDREAVAAWLAECGEALGHGAFEAAYEGTSHWRANEVWSYRLQHAGVPMRDGRVDVHWNGRTFVGLVNQLPGELLACEELAEPLSEPGRIYYPVRRSGGVELVLARIETSESGIHRVTRFVDSAGKLLGREVAQSQHSAEAGGEFEFTEYPVPSGTFPDQISPGKDGRIWYSQPNDDLIGSFLPASERFARFKLPAGARGPDGLVVDSFERVWTGLYYEGGLGRFDIQTSTFTHHPAPYAQPAMAIPVVTRDGHVWVSDHVNNRVSEFDPATGSWVGVHVMPTPGSWVVAGAEDTLERTLYFTQYNIGRLALKRPDEAFTEIAVPGSGPAFIAVSGPKVYYSQWNAARLGSYDTASGTVTEYAHPIAGEIGGPLARTPAGDIVVGTRNRGYILVFDTQTESFSAYLIPTPFPGLKDGLTVDRAGVIWFTESGVNKLGKLELR